MLPANYGATDPFGLGANELKLDAPRTYHIPQWDHMDDRKRIVMLRKIAEQSGRDPRIGALSGQILATAGVEQRNYTGQAAALLAWVQNNIAYINEPGEILQDPLYTLKVKRGDCDDMAILLAALSESIRLPWRYVLSGTRRGAKIRWIEGETYPYGAEWSHIYNALGWPPFNPTQWAIAEPTVRGVPLGQDVAMTGRVMPEMGGGATGSLGSYGDFGAAGGFPVGGLTALILAMGAGAFVGKTAFPEKHMAIGAGVGALVGTLGLLMIAPRKEPLGYAISVVSPNTAATRAVTASILADLDWKSIGSATIVGVTTSVLGQLVIDAVRAWAKIV
jgi:hypothetical protein